MKNSDFGGIVAMTAFVGLFVQQNRPTALICMIICFFAYSAYHHSKGD